MRIVTLMENTAWGCGLAAEHGLSLYIETGGYTILFDAGQSGAFAENAEKLGIDLRRVDFAVLSHGHYDHGGGLPRFLEINSTAPVYLSRHAFEPHYNAKNRDIGLNRNRIPIDRLIFVDGELEIAGGIRLHTCDIPPADTSGLQVLENGTLQPEDFRHEQYLVIEEKGKKICFSGCSHKGILNIMAHFRPDILVGGFHFMKIEDKKILKAAAEALLGHPAKYYTGHCTGETQFHFLKAIMGNHLDYLSTGSILEI